LALINQPTPISVLVEMLRISYEECLKAVQRWCRANLVLGCTQSASNKTENLYSYDHETKKIVALECLPGVLESPDKIAHLVYDFLLKTAQYDWLTLTGHLTTALELSNWVNIPAENGRFLRQLIEMIKTEGPPVGQVNDWLFVNGVPPAIQAQYLGYSLHCKFGEEERVVRKAESWIGALSNYAISSDKEARAIAMPLAHFCKHLRESAHSIYIQCLTYIQQLHQRYSEDGQLAGIYAAALAAGASVDVRDSIARNTEGELDALKHRYRTIDTIADEAAWNLMLLVMHHSRHGIAAHALPCLAKLKEYDSGEKSSHRIAEIRCTAIYILMASQDGDTVGTISLVEDARDILRRFADDKRIACNFVQIVGHSASLHIELPDLLMERIADIRGVLSRYPEDSEIRDKVRKSLEVLRVAGFGASMVSRGNYSLRKAIGNEIRSLFEILDKPVDSRT
jgi:hypothetical protein